MCICVKGCCEHDDRGVEWCSWRVGEAREGWVHGNEGDCRSKMWLSAGLYKLVTGYTFTVQGKADLVKHHRQKHGTHLETLCSASEVEDPSSRMDWRIRKHACDPCCDHLKIVDHCIHGLHHSSGMKAHENKFVIVCVHVCVWKKNLSTPDYLTILPKFAYSLQHLEKHVILIHHLYTGTSIQSQSVFWYQSPHQQLFNQSFCSTITLLLTTVHYNCTSNW